MDGEEIAAITHLIGATGRQLETQKELKGKMESFKIAKEQFLVSQDPAMEGYKLVCAAKEILAILLKEHLQDLVPAPYLEELRFFSSLADKKSE